jgi:hypothetical protein
MDEKVGEGLQARLRDLENESAIQRLLTSSARRPRARFRGCRNYAEGPPDPWGPSVTPGSLSDGSGRL